MKRIPGNFSQTLLAYINAAMLTSRPLVYTAASATLGLNWIFAAYINHGCIAAKIMKFHLFGERN
jgi:hypothetical protein